MVFLTPYPRNPKLSMTIEMKATDLSGFPAVVLFFAVQGSRLNFGSCC